MQQQPIDIDQLTKRCGNQPSIATKLLGMYFEQIDSYVEELKSAIRDECITEIQRIGHKIKSASVTVSANPLGATAAEIENHCKQGEIEIAISKEAKIVDQLTLLKAFYWQMNNNEASEALV